MKKAKPSRPIDPALAEVLKVIQGMTPTVVAKASGGWVGASTISNWRKGKVRSPLNYTLEAALHSAGYTRKIVKRTK